MSFCEPSCLFLLIGNSIRFTFQSGQSVNNSRLCVGKEWYRFPSHFFMPRNSQLNFVKSHFSGILPKHYVDSVDEQQKPKSFENLAQLTKRIPDHMNDMNREEPSRYVDLWTGCDFLIDLDIDNDDVQFEPNYSRMKDKMKIVYSKKFLLASKSHRLLRAFHVPFLSNEEYLTFGDYNLLEIIKK